MLYQLEAIPLVVNPIVKLKKLRQEWEEAAPDLLTTKAPVGLVLFDICQSLGLNPDEAIEVLGPDIYGQVIS